MPLKKLQKANREKNQCSGIDQDDFRWKAVGNVWQEVLSSAFPSPSACLCRKVECECVRPCFWYCFQWIIIYMHVWALSFMLNQEGRQHVFPWVGQLCQKELLHKATLLIQSDSRAQTHIHTHTHTHTQKYIIYSSTFWMWSRCCWGKYFTL